MGFRHISYGNLLFPQTPSSPLKPPFEKLEDHVNLNAVFKHFHVNLQNPAELTDSLRKDIIEYLCPYFSYAIANTIHLLDFPHCVLSGIIPLALGRPFIQRLQTSLDHILINNTITVEPSISRDTGIIGGAVAVFNHQLEMLFKESP